MMMESKTYIRKLNEYNGSQINIYKQIELLIDNLYRVKTLDGWTLLLQLWSSFGDNAESSLWVKD